jgi:non-ribosomal peptide synthetase component F
LAPLAFDASTFEIWGALLNGGKLAVLSALYPSLDDIAAALARHQVTTLWLTAGLFHLMVDQRLQGLAPLQQLIAGGDVLSPPHVAKVLRALPRCQLINGYGPTENTTFTCCYGVPRDFDEGGAVPIGKPIAHTQVYVLDEAGVPVADGHEGELHTGGAGVALGYLNRPELTAEKFIANPFASSPSLMYRTGDRVRRRADGNLEFLGRVDRQLKINGKRVELDEIEACIRRSGLVKDAAVTSFAGEFGARRVAAYVTSSAGAADAAEDAFHSVDDLRFFLKQELPDYMIPASITVLDVLPLSPTGKVDRAKLPKPIAAKSAGISAVGGAAPGTAPRNDIEAALLQIWRQVLGTEAVGVNDNFFDLGGTSLQLMQVHATMATIMKNGITVIDLFQYPRIGAMAAWLALRGAGPASAAPHSNMLTAEDRARRRQAVLTRVRPGPRSNTR